MDDEYAAGVWIKGRPYKYQKFRFVFTGNIIMPSGMSLDQVGEVMVETGHQDYPDHGHWLVMTQPNNYPMHLEKKFFRREELSQQLTI